MSNQSSDTQRILPSLPRPFYLSLAAAALIVFAVGLRIGLPIYRHRSAIREFQRIHASVHFRQGGSEWLWRHVSKAQWLGKRRMELVELVTEVDLRRNTAGPEINQALIHLKHLDGLHRLNLDKTEVDDYGLINLAGLSGLHELNLRETQITDAGMCHLQPLTGLTRLSLLGTPITDEGLEYLQRLTNLREVTVIRTQVTSAGVNKLKTALPGLKVITRDRFDDINETRTKLNQRDRD